MFEGLVESETGETYVDEYLVLRANVGPGPAFPKPRELVRLALEGYGRVYAYYLDRAGEPDAEEEGLELQSVVLDGLLVLFLEMAEYEAVATTCLAFREWPVGWAEPLIEHRFGLTRAWLEGRVVGAAVEEAVNATRREVAVLDPSTLLSRFDGILEERLKEVTERLERRDQALPSDTDVRLEPLFGDRLSSVPPEVRRTLEQAERGRINGRSAAERLGAIEFYRSATILMLEGAMRMSKLSLGDAIAYLESDRLKVPKRCPKGDLVKSLKRLAKQRNGITYRALKDKRDVTPDDVQNVYRTVLGDFNVFVAILDCFNSAR